MERLLLKGKSKEDMKLIADLAVKIGMTIEYIADEDNLLSLHEPEALAEWGRLTTEQQQGLLDAIAELDAGKGEDSRDVIQEMRKKHRCIQLKFN